MAQTRPTTLRPLHDRVLVKRVAEGDAKRGRIPPA
jgi:co-chaperonin GroES (HSP10)